jgi:TetR/AcrR family transcriptional regulator
MTIKHRRTSARDPERTRRRLLGVAQQQFAAKGFAGARVDEIARRARVNKQALYYHFGSKEALFREALESGYRKFRELDRGLDVSQMSALDGLAALVEVNYDYLHQSPELLAMIMDANREKGRLLHRTRIHEINASLVGAIRSILARGEREGVFRSGIDAEQFFLSFISLLTFYFTNRYTLSAVLSRNLSSDRAVRERRVHIIDLLLRAIRT